MPLAFEPQHVIAFEMPMAQELSAPELNSVYRPTGELVRLSAELPQHSNLPSVLIAQVCLLPALIFENVASGTVAWP